MRTKQDKDSAHADRRMDFKEAAWVLAVGVATLAAIVAGIVALAALVTACVWTVGKIRLHLFGVESGLCELYDTCAATPLELGVQPFFAILIVLMVSFFLGAWMTGKLG